MELTEARPSGLPLVLVNDFPLIRRPIETLRHPEFALLCGPEATVGRLRRYPVAAVFYGHPHIPRLLTHYEARSATPASGGHAVRRPD
ncbi:hypothetical protein [Nonomuraea jiangxiensis]|uniref:Uncharacterized protein n=1 Tax=Nonomuraea jiangxiensis TaxID=633440 RepID=A0A1G8SE42_9ACTN|nr:hypothetical protein SAMN05421869_109351 [Nonomuraea jiangxiensis]